MVCTGRFYDFIERRDGAGACAPPADLREGPHGPGRSRRALELDRALLESFPIGYRHLAYLQAGIGYTVKPDMPGIDGPEVEALYARGAQWLKGEQVQASSSRPLAICSATALPAMKPIRLPCPE